jgi:hypothetical protein
MASVGDQLTQPEAGWRRYDDTDPLFKYVGEWGTRSNGAYYNGSQRTSGNNLAGKVYFKFSGTRLRIITTLYPTYSGRINITIDGTTESFSLQTNTLNQAIVFEKLDLSNGDHTVIIEKIEKGSYNPDFVWDAIDIDSTGSLQDLVTIPITPTIPPPTTGKLCNTLDEMDIGDYIVWKRDGNTHSFGGSVDGYIEIRVTGVASSTLPTKHFHYAIKADTGLLISDRVTEHTISWDTLNSQKRIQGLPVTISGVSGLIRSLTGGVAYADENGNMSLNATGSKGCFPTNNEWDRYINKFPTDLIQQNKTLDDVWNCNNIYSWTQDTVVNGTLTSTSGLTTPNRNSSFRVIRGGINVWGRIWGDLGTTPSNSTSTGNGNDIGYRPVFSYKEV